MSGPIPVLIDTDPGIDDAVALLYALGAPTLDVRAVTTTTGNAPIEDVTRNAAFLLALARRSEIPLGRGAGLPLSGRPRPSAFSSHGSDGLGGVVPSEVRAPVGLPDAVNLMYRTLVEADETITLLALGPVTNVAELFLRHPDCTPRVRRVVAMSGAFATRGNVTADAEFNAWADPEALRAILDQEVEVVLVPLDVTERALLTSGELASLGDGPVSTVLGASLAHYAAVHLDQLGTAATQQHDALATVAVAVPSVVDTEPGRVVVDCSERPGATTFSPSRGGRHRVATSFAHELFRDELLAGLAAVDGAAQHPLHQRVQGAP